MRTILPVLTNGRTITLTVTPFTFDVFFSLLIDDAGAIDRFAVVLLVEILLSLSARVLNAREKGEMYQIYVGK